jgi:hypothetical protein
MSIDRFWAFGANINGNIMVAKPLAVAIAILIGAAQGTASAESACGLCAKSVVINSALAGCFLEKYPQFAARTSSAVAINLEDCESETMRSVVPALRGPSASAEEPSRKFFLSLPQLVCLKRKLEDPEIDLDPSAQIDLGDC